MSERRKHGFPALYYRVGDFALRHRWGTFACSLIVLVLGGVFSPMLKPQFFPKDLSYLSYVDVWLPPDAPLGATDAVTQRAETRHSARGRTIWKRTSSKRCSEIADHICRRRRSQILVLRRPRAATAQLCADPRRGCRQALHQRIRWAAADGAEPRSPGCPGRCAATRNWQAGRHSRFHSNFRSGAWKFCTVSLAISRQSFGLSQMRLGFETTGESLP